MTESPQPPRGARRLMYALLIVISAFVLGFDYLLRFVGCGGPH